MLIDLQCDYDVIIAGRYKRAVFGCERRVPAYFFVARRLQLVQHFAVASMEHLKSMGIGASTNQFSLVQVKVIYHGVSTSAYSLQAWLSESSFYFIACD